MNKELEEKMDELATEHVVTPNMIASYRGSFREGFRAAMELKLEAVSGLVEALDEIKERSWLKGSLINRMGLIARKALKNYERLMK